MSNFIKFSSEFIEKVKEKNDILTIASEYFNINKVGSIYQAKCIHKGDDKNPSLTFFEDKQSFYCFSCGAGKRPKTNGSDVISLVQWVENISWHDAIILLAKKANIPLPETSLSKEDKELQKLYSIKDKEANSYINNLYNLDKKTLDWYYSKGFTDDDICKWKLGSESYRSIPVYSIFDNYGRVVGFSRRVDNEVKYKNDKTSDIFKKGNILYGLSNIKSLIRKLNFVVLVEGFNDVIFLQKYGVPAVGLMGTALTDTNITTLSQYTKNILLFLDGDEAGINSSISQINNLINKGFNVKVVNVLGFDPDDIAKKYKEKTLSFISKNCVLGYQFVINNVLNDYYDSLSLLKQNTIKKLQDVSSLIENDNDKQLFLNPAIQGILANERKE